MTIEQRLRATFEARAGDVRPGPDPARAVRARFRRRRRARTAWVAGAAAVAVLVPGASYSTAALRLADDEAMVPAGQPAAVRGSLHEDEAFLASFRRSFRSYADSPVDTSRTRVLVATDAGPERVVVALATYRRLGFLPARKVFWFVGPEGSAPDGLSLVRATDRLRPVEQHRGYGYVLVLHPPRAAVEVSTHLDVGADGSLLRGVRRFAAADGLVVATFGSATPDHVSVRVFQGERVLHEDPVCTGRPLDWVGETRVQRAMPADRSRPSHALAAGALRDVLGRCGFEYSQVEATVFWGGDVAGRETVVAGVRAPSGGYLVEVASGDPRSPRIVLTVATGAGAPEDVWAWRPEEGSATVVVVGPRTAVRARVTGRGGSVDVPLADGFGLVTMAGPDVRVEALDVAGAVVADGPVHPATARPGGFRQAE